MSRGQQLIRAAKEHRTLLVESTFCPATLMFLELVFKLSTTGDLWPSLPVILLFSLSLGSIISLVSMLPAQRLARDAVRTLALLVFGILFGIEYFVYCQFKLFYDPTTVLVGASDAASQFGGTALAMVLSPSGLAHVALFLAPAILSGAMAFRQTTATPERPSRHFFLAQAGCTIACHLLALALIAALPPMGELYITRYSFQNAMPSFGLLTALRRDILIHASGQNETFRSTPTSETSPQDNQQAQGAQDTQATPATQAEAETSAETTAGKKRKRYKPNALDIDFEDLAASTDNATWAELDRYVATLTPSKKNKYTGLFKGYNLIFISAEAFAQEAIREDTTPTLWRMWEEGIQLTDYYQFDTAGTTGGECANLFGLLATEGGSSVKLTATHANALTLGSLLDARGYEGWAFHNNSYTYYDRNATHNNLGYSHGYIGYGNGMEQWVTWQWPESDLEMVQGTFDNLYGELGTKKHPFNVYYMSVSGHSNYDPWDNMMSQKNWDAVEGLPYSDRVKGYLACNVELDRAMEYLIGKLEERGIADRTVIVISADHFPYGLDDDAPVGQLPYLSELYGYEVRDVFQRDHNRPIIWCGSLAERRKPIVVDTPTMAVDLLPTLCNLFGLKWDSRLLPGRDVLAPKTEPLAFNLNYDWRTDLGTYWAGSGAFEPVEGAEVPDGYVEEHNAIVANKIRYCHGVLTSDYYRHVFGL